MLDQKEEARPVPYFEHFEKRDGIETYPAVEFNRIDDPRRRRAD
jgi:hypothetical protein